LLLARAARETLHMGDLVEIMLRMVMAAMLINDRVLVDQVSQMDNSVDSLNEAIKLYGPAAASTISRGGGRWRLFPSP
jgi:phosphate:Na+ symporter